MCPITGHFHAGLLPSPPRLELSAISKRCPGCLANDRIDLRIQPSASRRRD